MTAISARERFERRTQHGIVALPTNRLALRQPYSRK